MTLQKFISCVPKAMVNFPLWIGNAPSSRGTLCNHLRRTRRSLNPTGTTLY